MALKGWIIRDTKPRKYPHYIARFINGDILTPVFRCTWEEEPLIFEDEILANRVAKANNCVLEVLEQGAENNG